MLKYVHFCEFFDVQVTAAVSLPIGLFATDSASCDAVLDNFSQYASIYNRKYKGLLIKSVCSTIIVSKCFDT